MEHITFNSTPFPELAGPRESLELSCKGLALLDSAGRGAASAEQRGKEEESQGKEEELCVLASRSKIHFYLHEMLINQIIQNVMRKTKIIFKLVV